MTNSSAGAGRDGKLREQVAQRLQDVASFNGCCGNHKNVTCIEAAPADPTFWCKYCVQGQAAVLLAVPDPLASDTGQGEQPRPLSVALDALTRVREEFNKPGYMSSNLSFVRALDPVIEQFEAVERELASAAPLASSSAPQGESTEKITKI